MPNETQPINLDLEIRDEHIDTEAIMAAIRESIMRRREDAASRGIDFEALATGTFVRASAERFQPDLYESLYSMSVLKDKAQVGMHLTETAVPVISPFVQKLRRMLHAIALFYVNMSAERQIAFNAAVTKTTTNLVRALDRESDRLFEIESLKSEVARLTDRIAELEKNRI